jgi:alpha-glucosidase
MDAILAEPAVATDRRRAAGWHRDAVVYQIYPRSFLDTDGNGIGDVAGITRSLDYIAGLGVDAIWICPFFPSPMRDFGYDVSDYCGVDPMFGTLADFDELVRQAHAVDLRVIIDQVWSHSSDQHPWFAASRASREGPSADWYVWADARPDGSPPNNWLSVFGGGAWYWEPRRRQYYLHHFLSSQPALNLRHPALVDALFDAGRFWLDRGVDGFRLDAVDFMFHDPLLRDNPPRALSSGSLPLRPFGMQEHRYDMLHADALDFFAALRAMMAGYPGTATLGEISSEPGAFERCADYTDIGAARLDMAYTLGLMKRSLRVDDFAAVLREADRAAANGCVCWAFSNHDVTRATSRWGTGRHESALSRMLLALLLTLPGSACIYQGEELGLVEADVPLADMVDPYGKAFYPAFKGRDGSRTPIPWRGDSAAAGFTAARPWLPVEARHLPLAVDRQDRDQRSVLNFARNFIRWRKSQTALGAGTARVVPLQETVFALERTNCGGQRVLAAFNFTDIEVAVPRNVLPEVIPLPGHGFESTLETNDLRLPPYGAFFGRLTGGV